MRGNLQPFTSLQEEAEGSFEMMRVDNRPGAPTSRHSWLLRSESESEDDEDENEGQTANARFRRGKRRAADSEPVLHFVAAMERAGCFRLFFCCSRRTIQTAILILILGLSFGSFSIAYKSQSCWTPRDELLLLSRFRQVSLGGTLDAWPLKNAHSHNDYEQILPLYTALKAGFCSVEGDVFLIDDKLYLAHQLASVNERTLEGTYLEPLVAMVNASGQIYQRANRLGICQQFTVLVDIKSNDPPEILYESWERIESALKKIDVELADGRRAIETFDKDFNPVESSKSALPSPIRIVVTGVKKRDDVEEIVKRMKDRPQHKTTLDIDYETDNLDVIRASKWISVQWNYTFPDSNADSFQRTQEAILSRVRYARRNGLLSRYWGVKTVEPELWEFWLNLGVDIINTDSIYSLQSFLMSRGLVSETIL